MKEPCGETNKTENTHAFQHMETLRNKKEKKKENKMEMMITFFTSKSLIWGESH